MAFDVLPYVIGKGYTNQVALGIGNMRVEGTTVYFTIVETGEEIGVTLPTPADGVSVVDINLNDNHELTFFMSDGTEIVAGQIEAIKGNKGDKGDKGDAGENGVDGKDGFSPTVSVTEIDGGHKVNITDKSGTKSFDILNGEKGDKGDKGDTGANGTNGLKGEDGYTPVKGTDYWTDDDKTEIVNEVSSKTYLKSEIDIKFNSVNDDISANTEAINANKTDISLVKKNALMKNQGSENVGKILVVGTDGNLILTDMPESSASGDVTGVVDEANNILLSGSLADGTYTLKYKNADGTYTDIGTLEVGEITREINLFTTYPYQLNKRWSNSSKSWSGQNGSVGFEIPMADVTGKTMVFSGFAKAYGTNSDGKPTWYAYDDANTNLATYNDIYSLATVVDEENNIYSWAIPNVDGATKLMVFLPIYPNTEIDETDFTNVSWTIAD